MKMWHQLLFGFLLIWFGATIPLYCLFTYHSKQVEAQRDAMKEELINVRFDLYQLRGKIKNERVKPSPKKAPEKPNVKTD